MKFNFKKQNKVDDKKINIQNHRSSNYDWFNGSGPKAKTPKEKAQKVWKIIRSLIYVSLASLSLTGCIQTFIIKTDNLTGQGMEVYSKKENVAPHVNTITWDGKELTMDDEKANYWINPAKTDEKEILKNVHKQIEDNKGDIAKWKTENQAIQFIDKSNKSKWITNVVDKFADGKYMVIGESEKEDSWTADKTLKIKILSQKNTITKDKKVLTTWAAKEYSIDKIAGNQSSFAQLVFKKYYEKYLLPNFPKNLGKDNTDKLNTYYKNQEKLGGLTGLSLVEKNTKYTFDHKKSLIGFNLSKGSKLRAIYDWKTAWNLGPFYGMFVYPLSKLTLGMVEGMPMMGGWESIIAIFLAVIIIRTFAYGLTFKSTLQQVKQQELSAKRATIEAKYEQYKGNKQMEQRKRQEMSEMFKKEGISPLGAIGNIFLTMPIFLAMWKIIGGVGHFKSTKWLGINFASTSYKELFAGKWQYLPLMLAAGLVQAISLFTPRLLTKRRDKKRINAQQKAALKKANKTQNIMMVVFIVFAFIFTAGIQIYWIFGGLFTTVQNIVNHFIIKKQSMKKKQRGIK